MLATRERRQAKSREKAVQSVRETQTQEKWKSAKDIAKKHATELQQSFSRTFSRRKSMKQPDLMRGLSQAKPGSDAALPPMAGGSSDTTKKGKKKDKNKLTEMLQDIEQNPGDTEGFKLEIGDKNIKNMLQKESPCILRARCSGMLMVRLKRRKLCRSRTRT